MQFIRGSSPGECLTVSIRMCRKKTADALGRRHTHGARTDAAQLTRRAGWSYTAYGTREQSVDTGVTFNAA